MSPYLPVTPNEIVDSAFEAAEAGAANLHLHARDPETGRPDQQPEAFAPFLARNKQATNPVVNLTSGGSPFMTIEERIQPSIRFKPELASLNMGSMNFALFPRLNRFKDFKHNREPQYLESTRDLVVRDAFKDIEFAVTALSPNGTRFEFECYDVGHLYNLAHFAERKLIEPPFLVQTVFGIFGNIGTLAEETRCTCGARRTVSLAPTLVSAGGRSHANADRAYGAAIGAHVRVGLEDSLWIGKGRLARSNAEQVRRVRSIVAGLGLAPAKPNEARDILQLKRGVVLISTSSSARVSLQDLKRGD